MILKIGFRRCYIECFVLSWQSSAHHCYQYSVWGFLKCSIFFVKDDVMVNYIQWLSIVKYRQQYEIFCLLKADVLFLVCYFAISVLILRDLFSLIKVPSTVGEEEKLKAKFANVSYLRKKLALSSVETVKKSLKLLHSNSLYLHVCINESCQMLLCLVKCYNYDSLR